MEPLVALSIATAVVQFVDFSAKLIHGAKEIHRSSSGLTGEDQSLEYVTREMHKLSLRLVPSYNEPETDDERALRSLAAECEDLAGKILKLYNDLAPKDPTSKLSAFRSAWKNRMSESTKKELESRLAKCKSQLELQLNCMMSSDTKTRLMALASNDETTVDMLKVLQKHAEELRHGLEVKSISSKAQEQLLELLGLSESACKAVAQQHIRKKLAFPDMRGRFEAVEIAHYDTFRWIFEAGPKQESNGASLITGPEHSNHWFDSQPDNDQAVRKAGGLFTAWLKSGSGIFHVSGKPGSGKSTLMKFLCEHSDTKAKLSEWAGGRKLVFASFFFWKPASSRLPKSLNGLMRSLLHDVLQSCPELTAILFPNQWHQLLSAPSHLRLGEDVTFRDDEIYETFTKLMKHQETYKTHCFCFFIDGLDEYEETPQTDYKAMVKLLHTWTKVSMDNVKLCVSSREYNVFLNNFPAEKRIILQDLTRMDMDRYVRALLSDLEAVEEKKVLVAEILDWSHGIFLWVALVVKNLRECLEDGFSVSELRKELASLPRELSDLFRHLLESIRLSSRATAYLIFSMVYKLDTYKFKLPLHTCSFLDDYQMDPLFALRAELPYADLNATDLNTRNVTTRKKINGHCRGLVDFVQISEHVAHDWYLTFTHRSISEYFQEPSFQHDIATQLTGVIIEDAICQILLADIRYRDCSCLSDQVLRQYLHVIVSMRTRLKLDLPPYHYLFHLDLAVTEKTEGMKLNDLLSKGSDIMMFPHSAESFFRPMAHPKFLTSPFYLFACRGNLNFVMWMLTNKLTAHDSFARAFLISCLSLRIERREEQQGVVLFNIIESLIDRFRLSRTKRNDPAMAFAWTSFLASIVGFIPESCLHLSAVPLFGKIIASFLRAGADPRASFILKGSKLVDITTKLLGSPAIGLTLKVQIGTSKPRRIVYPRMCDERFFDLFKQGKTLSFRDMVRYWNLSNEKEIIDLIDERTKVYDKEPDDEQNEESDDESDDEQDDEQDTESPQQMVIDAPQDRETVGLDVARLVKSNALHESLEAEAMTAASKLGAMPQVWYLFHGFGYVGVIFVGLLFAYILPQMFNFVP